MTHETITRPIYQAIADGWIKERHAETVRQRMAATEVRFYSVFGHMPEQTAGLAQTTRGKEMVVLPSVGGEGLSTHELGHVFARIDGQSFTRYFEQQLGPEQFGRRQPAIADLYQILNEGFDEHMKEALLHGRPEIVRPSQRSAAGIEESPGENTLYRPYREIVGEVLGGVAGATTPDTLRQAVDSMVDGDFAAFADLVSARWNGHDVLSDLLEIIQTQRNERWNRTDSDAAAGHDELTRSLQSKLKALRIGIATTRQALATNDASAPDIV